MRRVLTAAALFLSSPALAGGLGVIATGGAHTEKVYFYSKVDPDGVEYENLDDYDQFKSTQTLPNFGAGLNLVLGDRDDRIVGDCRFFWNIDSAQQDPATKTDLVQNPAENLVSVHRDKPRHTGIGLVGLSWGILGNPANFQFGAVGHVGSGFVTSDHTEFLVFDIGPGVSYRVARQLQIFGDVVYMARFRKKFTHSVNGYAGVRYMFD